MPRYNLAKESFYAQIRRFGRTEDEKFQKVVCVKYKLEKYIYQIDLKNSVYKKFITKYSICNVL